jgi:hypothetical protein
MDGNNCPLGVSSMCTWGPISKGSYTWSLQCPYYSRLPTLVCHCIVMGSLQSFVIYKYFRDMCPLCTICHCLEASSAEVTFSAIRCTESSPSDPALP